MVTFEPTTDLSVPAVELPANLEHYRGQVRGTPATGLVRVSVNTPMDPSQRDFNPNDVIKYIEKSQGLDWNLFGYVTVVEDPRTGLRTMINGQHRTSIVRTLAPEVETVPAHIISTDDPQYAAKLFAYLNGVASRNVSREQLLWAEVLAGDPEALEMQRKLEYVGIACGRVNAGDDRRQISRACAEKCFKLGTDATKLAIALISQAYPNRKDFDNLLHGLVRLLTIPEYSGLSRSNTILGRMFAEWFTVELRKFCLYKESTQIVTRTDPWQNAIAYGLYKKFYHWMDEQGRKNLCPAKYHIGDLYQFADLNDRSR